MQRVDLYLGNEAVPIDAPGWEFRRGGKGVVTAWRDGLLQHHRSTWHRAHKWLARGVPTPERGSLVSEYDAAGAPLATVNGHRQNGTGWPGNRRRFRWRARRANWLDHDAMDRALIANLHAAGYTVILGADVNRTDMEPPHPDAIPLRTGGITQLWLIPALGASVDVGKGGSVAGLARGSGHRLQWRTVTM